MKLYEITLTYTGQCTFAIEADSFAQAEAVARAQWENGDQGHCRRGGEWCAASGPDWEIVSSVVEAEVD
jgi:hypothetical protein